LFRLFLQQLHIQKFQIINRMITIGYSTRESNPKFQEYLKKTCGHPKVQVIEKVNNGEKSLSQTYNEIINEDWSNSYIHKVFNSEFLFFIFKYLKKEDTEPVFISTQFWKMNSEDLDLANKFWELTKDNIQRGDYDNFISIRNNFICHVRTKGINSQDVILTPQGTYQKKRSFWLNSSYIKTQIKNEHFHNKSKS